MGGWVGLQKLITDLDMRNGHEGGVRGGGSEAVTKNEPQGTAAHRKSLTPV